MKYTPFVSNSVDTQIDAYAILKPENMREKTWPTHRASTD
jgi:hypothetical protein